MPGSVTRIGSGLKAFMAWISPGEVCVRSTTFSLVVKKVSHIIARRMVRGNIQQFEVVIVAFHFRGLEDLEAHVARRYGRFRG